MMMGESGEQMDDPISCSSHEYEIFIQNYYTK